ncbi:MAG TPA: fluoride efflux transporter CrcB [Burkholderiales bacterium]
MSWTGMLAVGGGAAVGAWLRWWLSAALNAMLPSLPLGTLAANLIGAYLIGVAFAAFTYFETLSPELRLLVVTGFLGGLTTFSTFSAEAAELVARAQYGWTAVLLASHVVGSIVLTLAGAASFRLVLG